MGCAYFYFEKSVFWYTLIDMPWSPQLNVPNQGSHCTSHHMCLRKSSAVFNQQPLCNVVSVIIIWPSGQPMNSSVVISKSPYLMPDFQVSRGARLLKCSLVLVLALHIQACLVPCLQNIANFLPCHFCSSNAFCTSVLVAETECKITKTAEHDINN